MVTEIYKDIRGYEELYQVSNLGNVRSLDRTIINSRNQERFIEGKILSPNKKRTGYLEITIGKNGRYRSFLIHRLVAKNFIENIENKPHINHIDGDKTNNTVSNLEWCTISENTTHALNNNLSGFRDRVFENLRIINEKASYKKVIFQKGCEFLEFESISKASDYLGLKRDNITRAIRKNQKVGGWQVFGYKIANEETLNLMK